MSIRKIFSVPLDMKEPTSTRQFRVNEGDSGNVIIVTLTDDGVPVALADNRVLAILSLPNGNTEEQDTDGHGVTVSGNVVTIELYTTSMSPGIVNVELQVYSGTNYETLVTSARFNFECVRSIMNSDTVARVPNYPILASLITQVQEAITGAQSNWAQTDDTKLDFVQHKPEAFPPTAHASTHSANGVDAITPTAIGAAEVTHASSHWSDGTDPVTPAAIGAAVVKSESVTLTVAGWTGDAAPYSQQILVNSIPATCSIIACAAPGYEEAYGDAEIKATAQELRKITFQAQDKPQSAVNVNLLILI